MKVKDTFHVGKYNSEHRWSRLAFPDDFAERIRDAYAGFIAAFSNAIIRAIDAGETLIIAKKSKLIPHGRWGKFLTRCCVGEHQAERYMRLAWLVAAKPTCKSDLADLSIEQAFKLLSPPKPSKETPTGGQPPEGSKPDRPDSTGTVIIAAWIGSVPNERTRALNAIGLNQVLAAMLREWWPLIESIVAHRHSAPATAPSDAISDDLEIPTFLSRGLIAGPLQAEVASPLEHDPKIDDLGAAYSIPAGRGMSNITGQKRSTEPLFQLLLCAPLADHWHRLVDGEHGGNVDQ